MTGRLRLSCRSLARQLPSKHPPGSIVEPRCAKPYMLPQSTKAMKEIHWTASARHAMSDHKTRPQSGMRRTRVEYVVSHGWVCK